MTEPVVLEGREMGDDAAAVYRAVLALTESFNQSLGSAFKQLNDRFDTEKESLRREVSDQLNEQTLAWGNYKAELETIRTKFSENFSGQAQTFLTMLQLNQDRFQKEMQIKIDQANESLNGRVPKAVGDYFADQRLFLENMHKEVEAFHEDIIAQNSKFTVDMGAKTGLVDAKLQTVLDKLRAVLKDL